MRNQLDGGSGPWRMSSGEPGRMSGGTPLSFAQRRLWFLDHLVGTAPVYSLGEAFRLRGRLDVAALRRGINEIVRRHEVLRTTFPAQNGEPAQVVAPVLDLTLPLIDLSGLAGQEQQAEARRLATEMIRQPFILAEGPLLRVLLLKLAPADHVFVVALHHIVADGWSIKVFLNELATLYGAYAIGREPTLPEVPLQYSDYASWQRKWLASGVLDAQLNYWRRTLDGAPRSLGILTDRPRRALPTFAGSRYEFRLPRSVAASLKALSREEGVTFFMTMLAVWKLLLSRYTSQPDIVVGCPIANRTRPGVERLIGCFVNLLVMRTSLKGDPSFRELLSRIRDTALEAYEHQDLPFEKLVEELRPERDPSQHPLVQVMFDLSYEELWMPRLVGLEAEALEVDTETAKFDLSLHIGDSPAGTAGTFGYSRDLFDEPTIARLASHYQTLLEDIARDPDRRLSQFTMLPREELDQLAEWNDTVAPFRKSQTVHELVEECAQQTPEAVAVVCGHDRLTYAELDARANRLACHLQQLGVGPETIVPVLVDRSLEMVVGWLGVLKAGGAFLPLDPEYPAERLGFMLDDVAARILLTQESLLSRLPDHRSTLVLLDTELGSSVEGPPHPRAAQPQNLAYVIYTSGSTGRPKGVMVTHRNLANLIAWHNRFYRVTPEDRASHVAGLGFDAAVWELWPYLTAGASVHLVEEHVRRSPEDLLAWLRSAEITIAFLPTPVTEVALRSIPPPAGSLRALLTGGDLLISRPPSTATFELFNNYGPTENTVCATACRISPGGSLPRPPIGRPVDNVQVYILDPSFGPAPIGVAGELYIGGSAVARGYLGRPGLTGERFVPNPFGDDPGGRLYRTGDLARYLPDGNIEFLGRADDQVKVRGFRVEPGEIEAVLSQSSDVSETVVIAHDAPGGGKRLVGYVVPRRTSPMLLSVLRAFLRERLPEQMIPSALVLLDRLPLTPNGKVDRKALPAPEDTRPEMGVRYAAPRSPLEDTLATIWAEVLHLDRVGIHDNFFEIGGDSMLSVQIVATARRHKLPIGVSDLLKYHTIADLSAAIERAAPYSNTEPAAGLHLLSEIDAARLPDGIGDAYPASLLQVGMFFHSEFSQSGTAYHQLFSYLVYAPLERESLEKAFSLLVMRHPVLRTSFDLSHFSEPLQLVHPSATIPLELDNSAGDSEESPDDYWRRWLQEQLRRPLQWTDAPLMRAAAKRWSPDSFQLNFLVHHAIMDAWSFQLFLTQFLDHYDRCLRREAIPAPTPNWAFRDFIRLEKSSLTSKASQAFWKRYLAAAPSGRLAGEISETSQAAIPSGRIGHCVAGAVVSGLHNMAGQLGVSLKSVLLAAHVRVVAALIGSTDVVTGVVVHGRPEVDSALSSVGLFLNTLPLRVSLEPSTSWRRLIRRLQVDEAECTEHARLPLAFIQRQLGGPPFETLFAFIRSDLAPERLASTGIRMEEIAAYGEVSIPVSVTFVEDRATGSLMLHLTYHSWRVSPEWAQCIVARYAAALEDVAKAATRRGHDE
jgi:amino acid adenylation domain-containing protein